MRTERSELSPSRWVVLLRGQEGLSLVEVLIAAAILLIVAVGILPLFTRSMLNNVSGYDSTQATSHGKSELETLFSNSVDSIEMTNPAPTQLVRAIAGGGDEMVLNDQFWYQGTRRADQYLDAVLGDERWVTDPATEITDSNPGLILWERTTLHRQFAYADINKQGVVDVNNPTQIVTLGHPELFDTPLPAGADRSVKQFRQEEVQLDSRRGDVDLDVGDLEMQFFHTY